MILHCMKKSEWEKKKDKECWGQESIDANGFIHCSTIEYFWRVAPNFYNTAEEFVLVCIDEDKLKSEVKYEEWDNTGRCYPHIYGLVNNDAVVNVLPFLKGENGEYVKNKEFSHINNK